jgi:hypothetical protein
VSNEPIGEKKRREGEERERGWQEGRGERNEKK